MKNKHCFIIAEAGVNHNGSLKMALDLIKVAAECGADAVKFQTFKAENLACPGTKTAEYQSAQTGCDDQYSMLKNLELKETDYHEIKSCCAAFNIEFMSTPFDEESADFLLSLGMSRIKIPSGEITHLPLLEYLAGKDVPLILSTGMSSLEEVGEAVGCIRKVRESRGFLKPLSEMLTLLHCTSNYPTALEDVNLKAMLTMQEKLKLPVGYSDHTQGTLVSAIAVAMGAKVVEKHFTLDRNLPGPDHQASLAPEDLKKMIEDIRAVELCLGDGLKQPRPSEIPVRNLVRRSLHLRRSMNQDELILEKDLIALRPEGGIPPKDLSKLLGKKLSKEVLKGHRLEWSDLVF